MSPTPHRAAPWPAGTSIPATDGHLWLRVVCNNTLLIMFDLDRGCGQAVSKLLKKSFREDAVTSYVEQNLDGRVLTRLAR